MNLSNWLRKMPRPAVIMADDQRIDVPRSGRPWRELTCTIEAMEVSRVTCLNAEGKVLRSITLEAPENVAPQSPEMADLQLFATLLERAYDKASSKMQPIVDSAMEFVERGGSRLAKAEAENERLRAHINKLNFRISELSSVPPPPEGESLIGAMVAGALQAQQTQTNSHPPAQVSSIKGAKK